MAKVSGHVIVCGLSALGSRVAEQLVASGVAVVVVDDRDPTGSRRRLERSGVRVVPESAHSPEALREADIDTALAVAACGDLDLDNLQTAIAAAEVAPSRRLVVSIDNAQLGDQLATAIPAATVINMADRVGPSFVEACIRSDVVHAFTLFADPATNHDQEASEVFAVVDAVVDEADAFRARYGDLTPIALRRPSDRDPVLCPPRDIPLAPGDQLTMLGRLAEFDARGLTVAGMHDARTFAEIAAVARKRQERSGSDPILRSDAGQGRLGRVRALLATIRAEFDGPFRWALAAVLTLVVLSTVVLRLTYAANDPDAPDNFDAFDALYLTVETMTTVGYGDFNFGDATHWLQAFGILLMLFGALSVAVIYAFITNVIISRKLEKALGRGRAGTVRGHVVLCGLGKVGTATMEGLLRAGRAVVVIERDEHNRFLPVARERGVPVVIGDATVRTTLLQAGLGHATAIAALTSDGVANLETVLSARDAYEELAQARDERLAARHAASKAGGRSYQRHARVAAGPTPDAGSDETALRVVLRVADASMTSEVERRFDIHTVRSAAALAAPYFVGAALGYDVISTFYVERTPFLVARMVVRPGAALVGPTLAELATGARILAVTAAAEPHRAGPNGETPAAAVNGAAVNGAAPARPNLRPSRHTRLRAGDELLAVGPVTEIVDMIRRNQRPVDARRSESLSPAGANGTAEPEERDG
ncbi:NAD-binding protein [Pseudofrankia inefficax]|uniref:TrkA-N domain protein n=1 Tax=Pseudofrankia inefficax (strain DSM 45817 / CECT 9037 / DDB 130130 / EuI1c) TaxID=298654 RepID=E3J3S3_PSEI1|nr:NAD-binding protein [Pseudofrankia inefficax]ADP79410.1 TrkA-N domain protein [Pseudofrankia inefficax]